jgi:hypothetical protein
VLIVTAPSWQFSLNNACVGSCVLLSTAVLKMKAVYMSEMQARINKSTGTVTQRTFPNLLRPFLVGEFCEEVGHQTGDI